MQEGFIDKAAYKFMQIQELILYTTSIKKTRQFYSKTMGFPIIAETEEMVSFRVFKSVLTFRAGAAKPIYHFAFNITNNRFSDAFEWMNSKVDVLLTSSGLPIIGFDDWNAQAFYFHDNNGNILEFLVRFDLPYQSTRPFSIADIREICEVGIVTDDVPATAAALNTKYKVPYFVKAKPTDNFTVLGDEYGLMIITKAGRGWLPTNKPAQKFPMSIVFGDAAQPNSPGVYRLEL